MTTPDELEARLARLEARVSELEAENVQLRRALAPTMRPPAIHVPEYECGAATGVAIGRGPTGPGDAR